MKQELVTLEVAKLAKEKGFDEMCLYAIDGETKNIVSFYYAMNNSMHEDISIESCNDLISMPTQSLLQKWLREKHSIHITIELVDFDSTEYMWGIYHTFVGSLVRESLVGAGGSYTGTFDTYEKALEDGLKEALKQIK